MPDNNDNSTHTDEFSNEVIQGTSGVDQNEQSEGESIAETAADNESKEEPTAEPTVDNESGEELTAKPIADNESKKESTVEPTVDNESGEELTAKPIADNESKKESTVEPTVDNENKEEPTAKPIVDNGDGGKLHEKLTTVNVEKPTTLDIEKPTEKLVTANVEKPTEKLTTANVGKPAVKSIVDGEGKMKFPVDEHLCCKHCHDPYYSSHHAAWYHTHDSGNTVIIPYGWRGGLPVVKIGGHAEFFDLNKPVLIPDLGCDIFDCY